jgi:hypothetical protein
MLELYIRNPNADRYIMFQDDLVTYKNLRQYLEEAKMPEDGYLNLHQHPNNRDLVRNSGNPVGWFRSNQQGRGAVALVFTRELLLDLFAHDIWIKHPRDLENGHQRIDASITYSLSHIHSGKHKEYCHNPSLVCHTGFETSILGRHAKQAETQNFRGEDFDALCLLKELPADRVTPIKVEPIVFG